MKKLLAILLLCLLPAWALAEAPPAGAVLLPQSSDIPLFLADGRIVLLPVRTDGPNTLPRDEVRCLNAQGLLWACPIPPSNHPWGGARQLHDGRIALVSQRADGRWMLDIIAADGSSLISVPLPDDLKPLIPAGDRVYGTLQGEEYVLYEIGLDGQVQRSMLHASSPNERVMWAWPRGEGHMLHVITKLRPEESSDKHTKYTGSQTLVYLEADGTANRRATLWDVDFLNGFGRDATPNHMGGLTALVTQDHNDTATIWVYSYDAAGADPRWSWSYTLDAHSVTPQLIDQRADSGYTIWGSGMQNELDNSGFVFRLDIDALGNVQALATRRCAGGWMVRYLNGQPWVYHKGLSQASVAPFDSLANADISLLSGSVTVADSDVRLPEAGISFTLPQGFVQVPARASDVFIYQAIDPHNGYHVGVEAPLDAASEAHLLRKVKGKNSGFLWQEDVRIGDNTYFVFHSKTQNTWVFLLQGANGAVARLCFSPPEYQADMPNQAVQLLNTLRFVTP